MDHARLGGTWQFTIDPEVIFSDGSPVTAADAELSLERVASLGQASLTAARLDLVTGTVRSCGRWAGAGADLAGVSVVDPATLQIALDRPMATLPELLAAPTYGIVPAAAVGGVAEASVSSGPFRVAGRDGDVLSLTRAAGRSPLLDQVDLHQYDDLAAGFEAFAGGELDWTLGGPVAAEAAAEEFGADGFVPFQAELFYGFNLADPRFADVRFRQAIVQAIDRGDRARGLPGRGPAAARHRPRGGPRRRSVRGAAGCAYDPAAARALLAQAFPAGGVPEVPIDFPDGADETAVAGIIEQNLEAVGIPAVLRPHPGRRLQRLRRVGPAGLRQPRLGRRAGPGRRLRRPPVPIRQRRQPHRLPRPRRRRPAGPGGDDRWTADARAALLAQAERRS